MVSVDFLKTLENKKRVGMGFEHHYLITELFNNQRNKEAAKIMGNYGSYQNAMQVARYPHLIPLFKQVLDENQDNIELLFFYVNLLKINLKYEEACELLEEYLIKFNGDSEKTLHILNNLGIVYWEQGNEECEKLWLKALEVGYQRSPQIFGNVNKSTDPFVWSNIYLGYYYGTKGKWAETTVYYDTAMNFYRSINRHRRINAIRILRLSHIIQDITRGRFKVEGIALTEQINHYIQEAYGQEQRPLAALLYEFIQASVNYQGKKEEIIKSYFKYAQGHQEKFNFMINIFESKKFKDGIDRLLFQEIDKYLFRL